MITQSKRINTGDIGRIQSQYEMPYPQPGSLKADILIKEQKRRIEMYESATGCSEVSRMPVIEEALQGLEKEVEGAGKRVEELKARISAILRDENPNLNPIGTGGVMGQEICKPAKPISTPLSGRLMETVRKLKQINSKLGDMLGGIEL
jgi:hypothetical protein